MTSATPPSAFSLAQIIVEKVQFSHTGDPFSVVPTPTLDILPEGIEMSAEAAQSDDGRTHVVRLRLFGDPHASQGVRYAFDVTVAGLFELKETLPREQASIFMQSAATILFPFVREMVANLTSRGRFGVAWLQPINVRAALAEAQANEVDSTMAEPEAASVAAAKPKGRRRRNA